MEGRSPDRPSNKKPAPWRAQLSLGHDGGITCSPAVQLELDPPQNAVPGVTSESGAGQPGAQQTPRKGVDPVCHGGARVLFVGGVERHQDLIARRPGKLRVQFHQFMRPLIRFKFRQPGLIRILTPFDVVDHAPKDISPALPNQPVLSATCHRI